MAPETLRRRVYEQTEILRKWYAGRMRDELPPYRNTIEGYVYAYMPRGYRWIDELAEQSRELKTRLEKAKRIAVIGAGPAPELWSFFRRIKEPEQFELFDSQMDDWWSVIEQFTLNLLQEERKKGLLFDWCACGGPPDARKLRKGMGADLTPGERYDAVVAQQVLNERANSRNEHTSYTVHRWATENLTPDGTLVVLERSRRFLDNSMQRASLWPGRVEKLSVAGEIEARREDLDWPRGEWGPDYVPRIDRAIEAVVMYGPR